ncbi:MAG TPA: peptide ABC transporter permease [Porticoccaceae bacterium]|nr:peptide ABC transporter permease [Porticoccaceae bacterium]
MRILDLTEFNYRAISRQRMRSTMLLIAIAIGVLAINLLTGIGEGGKQFVLGEFDVLGKNVLIVIPGKKETTGGMPPLTGETTRDLTLGDAEAILRLPNVSAVAPLIPGEVEISAGALSRNALTFGTSAAFFSIRQLSVAQGRALPQTAMDDARPVCVIGSKLRRELFGNGRVLGQWLRAGDRRFRVIGVIQDRGQSMGFDMSDAIVIPVASAQTLFNTEGLFRIFVEVRALETMDTSRQRIIDLLRERHDGEEDVTLITQDSLLSAFTDILDTMTLAVAGIAGISMLVAGILIMNVTLISVSQRTREIGLLKALGTPARTVRLIFLSEAALIALVGGLAGLAISELALLGAHWVYPSVPFATPNWARAGSLLIAIATALLFAALPAQKAAKMAPVDALLDKKAGQG